MTQLNKLTNETRDPKRRKRVGRGPGSGMGKTSCRGVKGAGARSGYKRRLTYEGGGMRLFQRLPQRGFSNVQFKKDYYTVNLGQIEKVYADGEAVNRETLKKHGIVTGKHKGIKLLGTGTLTKKLGEVQVDAISASARAALEGADIVLKLNGEGS